MDLILNPSELRNLKITNNGSTLELSATKWFEFPLKLKLKLAEGSRELFFQNVTYMLLRTISDLNSSQKELRDEMKKKDREIDGYKTNNHARYLKTERFNDEDHMKRHQMLKKNGDLVVTPDALIEKVAAAASQKEITVQENLRNLKIKQEINTPTETQSAPCLTSNNVKKELKVEPRDNTVSPRKKRKQLLNY